jgi:AraC-like DNA-binding protein
MTTARYTRFHAGDPDGAERGLDPAVRLDHVPRARFAFRTHAVTRGPLQVEETRCTDAVRVRLTGQRSYVVGLPVRGALHADHRGRELDLGPGQAAIFTPPADAALCTCDRFDVLLVQVGEAALEDALEALLGRTVRRPLPLPTSVSLTSSAGRAWTGAVRQVADAHPGPTSVLANPISAEPLQDALLSRLLFATDHRDRDALDARVPTWGPRTVRSSADYIEAHPEHPLTPTALAEQAGLSVRALQGCWLRHRGTRPQDDLDRVRLDRAHRDLGSHRPGETTVGAVAAAWGFRPRPFVAAYGSRFGCHPAQTLRGPAFA